MERDGSAKRRIGPFSNAALNAYKVSVGSDSRVQALGMLGIDRVDHDVEDLIDDCLITSEGAGDPMRGTKIAQSLAMAFMAQDGDMPTLLAAQLNEIITNRAARSTDKQTAAGTGR